MELRQVRYFAAVAEELHFGRAASRSRVAQPAVSKQIRNLEHELGVRLFDRGGRRLELTDAGRAFLEKAYAILEQVGEAERAAVRAGRGEVGRLALGFTGMTLYSVMPEVVRAFGERFPEVELALRETCTRTLTEALLAGRLDAGFLHPPVAAPEIAMQTVLSEPMVAVLPQGHRLTTQPAVPLELLAGEPFVLFPQEEGPELHDRILEACRARGFRPRLISESPSPHTAVGLVAAGMGVSLVWASMRNLKRPGVVYRSLREPTPLMETALAWRRDNSSSVLRQFLQVAGETIRPGSNGRTPSTHLSTRYAASSGGSEAVPGKPALRARGPKAC